MSLRNRNRPQPGITVIGLIAVSALSLTACGSDTAGAETGTDVEDIQEEPAVAEPYDGVYDTAFYEGVESYDGEEVTVSADINEIISPTSFTIAGTDDTTVEPLLIVHDGTLQELAPDLTVAVTGTVHRTFDLPTVEDEIGLDFDDALFEEWEAEPYIEASKIDTSVASDQ